MSGYVYRIMDPGITAEWLNSGYLIPADIVRCDPMSATRVMLMAYMRDAGELELISAEAGNIESDPVVVSHVPQALAVIEGPSTGTWSATVKLEGRVRSGTWITLPLTGGGIASYAMLQANNLVTVTMDLVGWDEVRAVITSKAGADAATSPIYVNINGGV